MALARGLGIAVAGFSFHVGSQTATPAMYVEAIGTCAGLIQRCAGGGAAPGVLDIGGGFPVDYVARGMQIEEFCAPISAALAGLPPSVQVYAEPGRYIVAPAATAVAAVMGRALRDERWWYYLDDGLYGSYSGQLYDHARFEVDALKAAAQRFPAVLAGPTCDSIDVIAEDIALPLLEAGDLVAGRSMGAYTWASATDFNLFPRATVLVLDRGELLTPGR